MQEYGIYIHFPFCTHKCFYCDFYSLENFNTYKPFISSLMKEINLRTENLDHKPNISSLFIGGGTPSLIESEDLSKVIEKLKSKFTFRDDAELTIECNPGTMVNDKFNAFREIGFNRLSLGVQSFVPEELKFLERIHSAEEAENAISSARNAGFDNISIDLIFSIPGQTHESLEYSLNKAIECNTNHISAYSLIYESGTPLYKAYKSGKISKVEEDQDADNYRFVMEFLRASGFEQYEVSNFTKDAKYCLHNLDIWHGGEYFAFGPSAHGYLSGRRYNNFRSINKYNSNLGSNILPEEESEILDNKIKLEERLYLGLRSDGVDIKKTNQEFNLDIIDLISDRLPKLLESRMVILDDKIRLSSSGYPLCDAIYLNIFHNIIK